MLCLQKQRAASLGRSTASFSRYDFVERLGSACATSVMFLFTVVRIHSKFLRDAAWKEESIRSTTAVRILAS